MPKFPHSGYSTNQSSGVFVRAQGSPSPSLEIEDQSSEIVHPFKVSCFFNGTEFIVSVRAGTVNNIVPTIDGDPLDAATPPTIGMTNASETYRIYIKASSATPPVFFPDTLEIIYSDDDEPDTDTYGYLKIASVTVEPGVVKSINQFVYASQVLVRAKPGTATALWSWSSR